MFLREQFFSQAFKTYTPTFLKSNTTIKHDLLLYEKLKFSLEIDDKTRNCLVSPNSELDTPTSRIFI